MRGILVREMAYLWNIDGILMEYLWNIDGIFLAYLWNIFGLFMEYFWLIHGIFLDFEFSCARVLGLEGSRDFFPRFSSSNQLQNWHIFSPVSLPVLLDLEVKS